MKLLPFLPLASAAVLFEGATIITYENDSLQILRDASLLVEDDTITSVIEGTITDLPNGTEIVNATDHIISPGFIDTHHHLWQTAFKTIASNTSLVEYFQRYGGFGFASTVFNTADVYLGQLTGALECIHEGTTTILDHAHGGFSNESVDAIVNATVESGVRTFFALSLVDLPTYPLQDQIYKLASLTTDQRFNNITSLGLAFDGFVQATQDQADSLWTIAQNLSVITTHYVGGPWQAANSPEIVQRLGWLNQSVPIIFSHASFLTYADAALLRATNQYVSTTPESEFHYGHGHPNIELIQDQAALGIDTHFTYSSSMVQQARLWLQSLRIHNYQKVLDKWQVPGNNPMSVNQAFMLVTRNGALALRRDDLGVIRPGAKADLVVFNGNSPNMLGWSDPVAAIILHSNVGDIQHVMVGGQFVKRNGSLTFDGYPGIQSRFRSSASRLQQVWADQDWSPLAETVPNYGEAEVIDTQRGNGTGY